MLMDEILSGFGNLFTLHRYKLAFLIALCEIVTLDTKPDRL